MTSPVTPVAAAPVNNKSAGGDLLDLLGDLDMGGGGGSNGAPNIQPATGGMLLDGLGGLNGTGLLAAI